MGKKIKITESFDNVYAWGISTSLPELKLVLLLNRHLHIGLRRSINIMGRGGYPTEGFPTFTYVSEKYEFLCRYILFINRLQGYSLFASCPQFDYLLVMTGNYSTHELQRTVTILRSLEEINACISITIDTLKQDKEYFLLFE